MDQRVERWLVSHLSVRHSDCWSADSTDVNPPIERSARLSSLIWNFQTESFVVRSLKYEVCSNLALHRYLCDNLTVERCWWNTRTIRNEMQMPSLWFAHQAWLNSIIHEIRLIIAANYSLCRVTWDAHCGASSLQADPSRSDDGDWFT